MNAVLGLGKNPGMPVMLNKKPVRLARGGLIDVGDGLKQDINGVIHQTPESRLLDEKNSILQNGPNGRAYQDMNAEAPLTYENDVLGGKFDYDLNKDPLLPGPKFAKGGIVNALVPKPGVISGPGTPTSDSIPAALPPGDAIIPAAVAQMTVAEFLESQIEKTQGQPEGEQELSPAAVSTGEIRIPKTVVNALGKKFVQSLIDANPEPETGEAPVQDGVIHAAFGIGNVPIPNDDDKNKIPAQSLPVMPFISSIGKNPLEVADNPQPNPTPALNPMQQAKADLMVDSMGGKANKLVIPNDNVDRTPLNMGPGAVAGTMLRGGLDLGSKAAASIGNEANKQVGDFKQAMNRGLVPVDTAPVLKTLDPDKIKPNTISAPEKLTPITMAQPKTQPAAEQGGYTQTQPIFRENEISKAWGNYAAAIKKKGMDIGTLYPMGIIPGAMPPDPDLPVVVGFRGEARDARGMHSLTAEGIQALTPLWQNQASAKSDTAKLAENKRQWDTPSAEYNVGSGQPQQSRRLGKKAPLADGAPPPLSKQEQADDEAYSDADAQFIADNRNNPIDFNDENTLGVLSRYNARQRKLEIQRYNVEQRLKRQQGEK